MQINSGRPPGGTPHQSSSAEIEAGGKRYLIPILYEDRTVLALDKPAGWMLAPGSWRTTSRNLQSALSAAIAGREFWARTRNLKFLRFVHRLDAETTGVLVCSKSAGAIAPLSRLFELRQVEKSYLAVVHGIPRQNEWKSLLKIAPHPDRPGQMQVDARFGKEAETHFKLLGERAGFALVEARPLTGRTHQIRVHLAADGYAVVGDPLYRAALATAKVETRWPPEYPIALRAIELSYPDPFTRRQVRITAPTKPFLKAFGFSTAQLKPGP